VHVLASRLSWRRLPWLGEVISIGVGYVFYSLIRVLANSQGDVARLHAEQVIAVERWFGIFHEMPVNAFLTQHHWLELVCSYYYATLHFVVTPLLLAWLWHRRARLYAPLRSALVIASGSALVVYAAWPLAPPRFTLDGAVDTIIEHPVVWASGPKVEGFFNDFAAMPSLHVAWAVWCAMAVTAVLRSRWRHLAWLYPIGTTLVVVATANHFLLDAVGGLVIVAVPWYLCGLRIRRHVPTVYRVETMPVSEPVAA
jgi:hypothetical protein